MTVPLTLPLEGLSTRDLPVAGGKATGLGELIAAGLDVPEGFVLTTEAYRVMVASLGGDGDLGQRPADLLTATMPAEVKKAILAAYSDLGQGVVAVRSSATAEDLAGAAFAGQQDTILGVVGDDELLKAVRECWESLWGERVVTYRDKVGIDSRDLAIAVVVQRMLDADHAGVMFTANPVTGARDEVVIESNPGLGEAVVSGLVTPDHAVIDASGRVIKRTAGESEVVITLHSDGGTRTTSASSDVSALPDDVLARIAEAGRRMATRTGRPMDLEWAMVKGHAYMLQARPMTALPPPPRRLTRIQRTSGPIILELLPHRPTPLELTAWVEPIIAPFVEQILTGMAGLRIDFHDVFVTEDGVLEEFVPPSPKPTWRIPAALAHDLAVVGRDPAKWTEDPLATRYDEECRTLTGLDCADLDWASLLRIPRQAQAASHAMTQLRIDYLPAAIVALLQLTSMLRLLGMQDRTPSLLKGIQTTTKAANDQLAAIAANIRSQPDRASMFATESSDAILQHIRTDPAARPILRQLDEFLRAYGHRETGSIALVRDPSWADSPETVVGIIKVLLEAPHDGDHPSTASSDALSDLLAQPRVQRLGLGKVLNKLVTSARAGFATREDTHFAITRLMPPVRHSLIEIGRRLASHGWLANPDDVWFLTWPEVEALPDPAKRRVDATVASMAARRAAAYAERASAPLIAPATLYGRRSRGRSDDVGVLVSGTGGGGGTASGPARVIRHPDEFGCLQSGEVLVCPATNPSWTPLFARAAAIVVDHGGIASHAAIVAREYGIPAVMGCGSATDILRTGQPVTVDGDRGLVRAQQT